MTPARVHTSLHYVVLKFYAKFNKEVCWLTVKMLKKVKSSVYMQFFNTKLKLASYGASHVSVRHFYSTPDPNFCTKFFLLESFFRALLLRLNYFQKKWSEKLQTKSYFFQRQMPNEICEKSEFSYRLQFLTRKKYIVMLCFNSFELLFFVSKWN